MFNQERSYSSCLFLPPLKLLFSRPYSIFVDVSLEDCNIDTEQIEKNISKETGAILPVHLFGKSSNMDQILLIAESYELKIVEDTAQALNKHGEKYLGTIGDAGCFSFSQQRH